MELRNNVLKEIASLLVSYKGQVIEARKQSTRLVDYVNFEGQEEAIQKIINTLPSLDEKFQAETKKPSQDKKQKENNTYSFAQ